MQEITARIIDPTHLELSQPLTGGAPGDVVQISLTSPPVDDMTDWREVGKKHLLDAYADEDAIYDDL
jgi:hypothetical protein